MITLEYPFDSPIETLELPSPQLSDPDSIQTGLTLLRTVTGAIYTYKKVAIQNLLLTIPNVKEEDMPDARAFLIAAIGQEIKYTDTIGRVWQVHITNPMIEFTNTGRERYTLTLQLEGVVT